MSIDRIVVGIDFSDTAMDAARWAREFFAPSAEAVFVHVFEPPDRPRFSRDLLPTPEAIESSAREFAARRMSELSNTLQSTLERFEFRVGKPYEEIIRAAAATHASVVVVGPHGERRRAPALLGTTAERIVRTSSVPVLVATKPRQAQPRKLLVPVDDAAVTPRLLEWSRDLAQMFHADITLLHVWSNAIYSHVASMSRVTTRTEGEAHREIAKEIRAAGEYWLREMAETGIVGIPVHASVTHGRPGDEILKLAGKIDADLIILGRQGSGLVAPALLGSTVGAVLHEATCPVLVVP